MEYDPATKKKKKTPMAAGKRTKPEIIILSETDIDKCHMFPPGSSRKAYLNLGWYDYSKRNRVGWIMGTSTDRGRRF